MQLDYKNNASQIDILESIFIQREYADFFPFYQHTTIIDIGAHYGYFSLFARQNSADSSQIIALEPSSHNFKNLQKNIASNQAKNIKALNRALGPEEGILNLHLGESTNNSMLPDYEAVKGNKDFEEVTVSSLDALIEEFNLKQIDFLKMDCEGAEYEILDKLSKTAWNKIITLSMEFHDLKLQQRTGNSLIKLLKERGFQIARFHYEPSSMNLNYGKIIALNKNYH